MQIRIRSLEERDLAEADRILRLAFGTFFGPDPLKMFGNSDFAYTRFRAAPDSTLAAEADGQLVGSNFFVTHWGSFGFFGPLSVEPRLWEVRFKMCDRSGRE